jgi:hypothetical protein
MYPKGHAYNDLDIEDRLLEGRLPIAVCRAPQPPPLLTLILLLGGKANLSRSFGSAPDSGLPPREGR